MATMCKENTSTCLSNSYPSYYCEFQILNWTKSLLVVIDRFGHQEVLDKCIENPSSDGKVVVQYRSFVGRRASNGNSFSARDIDVPGMEISVPYADIFEHPVYIKQCDVVVALVEQAGIAVHPANKELYDNVVGTYVPSDEVMRGTPVFSIMANDPYGRWDELMVNVFGKTMYIPVSHCQSSIDNSDEESGKSAIDALSKLTFVARYHGEIDDEFTFSVPLVNVDNGKATVIPDGTLIYIATDIEHLQDSISSGRSSRISEFVNNKQGIPKSIYEQEKKIMEDKLASMKAKYEDRIKTDKETATLDLQKVKNDLEAEHQLRVKLETEVKEWQGIHSARVEYTKKNGEMQEQVEKTRKESYAADQKRIERDAVIIKIVGTTCVAITSFCISLLAKTSKK